MNSNDHPNLTAYALGELDAEHAEAMSRWVTENEDACAEVNALSELGQHLQNTAQAPLLRLHPHQRDAVLSGPERVRQMVAAASHAQRRRSSFAPFFYATTRVAAAAALVIGGFIAGTHIAEQKQEQTVASKTPTTAPAPTTAVETPPAVVPPFRAKEVQPIEMVATTTKPEAAPTASAVTASAPQKTETLVVATAPVTAITPSPKEVIRVIQPKTHVLAESFVSTTKTALAQVNLNPAETRYTPAIGKEAIAAAPMAAHTKSIEPAVHNKQPELLIHSWKAEVASCPWNEGHRLLRLTIQIPGEQVASNAGANYPLQVNFSANHVRSYRQVCQRSIPAAAADAPAFHIVWYEFQPNGQAAEGATKAIGSVTLANARFTTTATGPFDGSKLQVVDRGTEWTAARDDFLFESAVVGFGLLLKGEKDSGKLDHNLVLDLAQRAGADDRNGERAQFVKLVQDAQRAAGL